VRKTLRVLSAMLGQTSVDQKACARAAADSALLATDLAEYLVRRGLAFRQAHHAVGRAVALAEELGKGLGELSVTELQSIDPHFERDVREVFDLAKALPRRRAIGAPGDVRSQLKRWQKILGS
jgi:argininosuccinate lyase